MHKHRKGIHQRRSRHSLPLQRSRKTNTTPTRTRLHRQARNTSSTDSLLDEIPTTDCTTRYVGLISAKTMTHGNQRTTSRRTCVTALTSNRLRSQNDVDEDVDAKKERSNRPQDVSTTRLQTRQTTFTTGKDAKRLQENTDRTTKRSFRCPDAGALTRHRSGRDRRHDDHRQPC